MIKKVLLCFCLFVSSVNAQELISKSHVQEEIKDAIPHSEIVVLDHCDHFPYIEQPSQFFTN